MLAWQVSAERGCVAKVAVVQIHLREEIPLRVGAVALDLHRVYPVASPMPFVLDVAPSFAEIEACPAFCKLHDITRVIRHKRLAVGVELVRAVICELVESDCELTGHDAHAG